MQPSWGGHTRWEATDGTLGAGAQRCKCSEGAAGKALPCVHSVQGVSQAGSRADLGDVGEGGAVATRSCSQNVCKRPVGG